MNPSQNENPFNILFRHDIECYKCNNFGHLAKYCQLKISKQETLDEICGVSLYSPKGEDKWYIDSGCTQIFIWRGFKL